MRPKHARRLPAPPSWVAAAIAFICGGAPIAAADLNVPPTWYAGDLHAHWPDSTCYGVAPPQLMADRMPEDLNLVSVQLWGGGGTFEEDALAYFRGKENDPVSTPDRIVHYDLEVSAFDIADRLGHCSYLNLASIDFPRAGYHGPIQAWARAQDAVIGSAHAQAWTATYHQFPPLEGCCVPYEVPVAIALGRLDYLDFQGNGSDHTEQWRFFWYSILNCGFRPAIAATSDSWCIHPVGSYRTYARIPDQFTYETFVTAVAQGRTVAVQNENNFIHFTLNGLEVGDEIAVGSGEALSLRARVILPDDQVRFGQLEFIRNGEVIGAFSYGQIGGEFVATMSDVAPGSSWYSARTRWSHAGAVFVEVDGRPIRPSPPAGDYYVRYMDYLRGAVLGGYFYQLTPAEEDSLLADIARARDVYEVILDEALKQSVGVRLESSVPRGPTLSSWPNPFQERLHIAFEAEGGSPVAIRIFAVDGRLVRRLARPGSSGGEAVLVWDGRDDGGARMPDGVYYYRVEAGERSIGVGRAVRVRGRSGMAIR